MAEVIVRYAHFIGILLVACTLFTEHMLLKKELAPEALRKIARLDALYGVSAIIVFLAGISLWVGVGKPASFYSGNHIFMTKLLLFFIVAGLSVIPTLFFIKNRKAETTVQVPKKIIMFVRAELAILFILPLLATLMARGIGQV